MQDLIAETSEYEARLQKFDKQLKCFAKRVSEQYGQFLSKNDLATNPQERALRFQKEAADRSMGVEW